MDPRARRVLIGGIEPHRSGLLAAEFVALGHSATIVADARACIDERDFDLLAMPVEVFDEHRDVLESCARRQSSALLILGHDAAIDDVDGVLEVFVPADAEPREAVLAGAALMARHDGPSPEGHVRWGPLVLDSATRSAHFGETSLSLTRLEFRILRVLIEARGAVVTRSELERSVFGDEPLPGGDRVVAHIRRIRRKIEPDPAHPWFLLTVRGEGFRLANEERAELAPATAHDDGRLRSTPPARRAARRQAR